MSDQGKTRPVHAVRINGVEVAIWKGRDYGYSMTFQKSWKDKQTGDWKHTTFIGDRDAGTLVLAIHEAHLWMRKNPNNGDNRNQPQPQRRDEPAASQEDDDTLPAVGEHDPDGEVPF